MRKNLFFSLLFCSIALLNFSCSKDDDPAPVGPTTYNVSILPMSYNPATLTVKKGSIIKWTNNDATPHTVTSDDGTSFNSNNIPAGSTFSLTTGSATGNFPYHCTIHGVTMAGTLIITN